MRLRRALGVLFVLGVLILGLFGLHPAAASVDISLSPDVLSDVISSTHDRSNSRNGSKDAQATGVTRTQGDVIGNDVHDAGIAWHQLDTPSGSTVGLLLQLTDIHLSVMEAPAGDPERAPDLLALASGLLARWPVAAAVLTGDLTEAKNVYGRGNQDEREWQMYRDTWNAISSLGNVPYNQIYDVRGNHDTFNSGPRCGPQDYYCTYSARAARVNTNSSTNDLVAEQQGPRDRVFIDAVYGNMDRSGSIGRGGRGGDVSACPVAMVVGLDASLDPGMRSPTNFLGVVAPAVLDELEDKLATSMASMRTAGCSPPYIAYGHYPLSTIAYPGRQRRASSAASMSSVQQVLVRHGVSAYLAGHLHGAFGRKLHRLHKGFTAAGSKTSVSARWPTGHMLELEMVDWKYARTVRLLTVDSAAGGVISFMDFQYTPPRPSQAPAATSVRRKLELDDETKVTAAGQTGRDAVQQLLVPFDTTSTIGEYLPLITCPPDARYSPQLFTTTAYLPYYPYGSPSCSTSPRASSDNVTADVTAVVRVLLLPVDLAVPAVPSDMVYLHWYCEASGSSNPRGNSSSTSGHRRLSGAVQMRLEYASANYSTFTTNLLSSSVGSIATIAQSDETTPGSNNTSRDSDSSILSCPPGIIVVQARVSCRNKAEAKENGKESNSCSGRGVASSSAERLLRWHLRPPPPPALQQPSSLASSSQRRLSASVTSIIRDAFWGRPGGAIDEDRSSGRRSSDSSSTHSWQPCAAPLQQTTMEWLVMHVPFHRFGLIAFAAQWCILTLGFLALPRALALWKTRYRQEPSELLQEPPQQQRLGREDSGLFPHDNRDNICVAGALEEESKAGEELWELTSASEAAVVAEEAGAGGSGTGGVARLRQVEWTEEGARSTSVRLIGGMGGGSNGGKSSTALLKRSSSGSSGSSGGGIGIGVSTGRREAYNGGGGGAAARSSSGQVMTATPRASRQASLNPGGGGGWSRRGNLSEDRVGRRKNAALMVFWHTTWEFMRHWLLWPPRDLIELAEDRDFVPWLALFLYGIYLAVGPWLAAEFVATGSRYPGNNSSSSSAQQTQPPLGSGYGILMAYGIYIRTLAAASGTTQQLTSWVSAAPSHDHVVIINVVFLTCMVPGLLLCASAAARMRRMAAAGKLPCNGASGKRGVGAWDLVSRSWQQVLSWRQSAALCIIALFNLGLCWKLWAGLGWAPVVLSPGTGWLIPLLTVWLWMTKSRVSMYSCQQRQQQQPVRRQVAP